MSALLVWSLAILYYVIGCFVFCWWIKVMDGECDGEMIGFSMTLGWMFWPLELLAIALIKVFA